MQWLRRQEQTIELQAVPKSKAAGRHHGIDLTSTHVHYLVSTLKAMASTPIAMPSNLITMASTILQEMMLAISADPSLVSA